MNPYPLKPPVLDMEVSGQHNNVGANIAGFVHLINAMLDQWLV